MRNGFVPLWILVIIALALLFVPIPFRYGQVLCEPCQSNLPPEQCSKCPMEGQIGWGPSIGKRILWAITKPEAEPAEEKKTSEDAEGKFCGGIAANLPENQCPEGYKCQLAGNYPDAGGKCVKAK